MSTPPPISRRLLLGRLGSGSGIVATYLLPGWFGAVQAAPARRAVPPRPATKAPLPVVMLDPGHGGKDPGAIGVSGTYEKQVALATAFELRRQLEATGQYRVELTRVRDTFIPLEERVAKAQDRGWLCSSRCMPMRSPTAGCVVPASIHCPTTHRMRKPQHLPTAKTVRTGLPGRSGT